MRVGLHIRTQGDLRGVAGRAVRLGCETIQIFSGNPRGWTKAPFDEESASEMIAALALQEIHPLFVHSSYLPNLASPDEELWNRSIGLVAEELTRTAKLKAEALVLHLGSPGREATRPALRIAEGVRLAYKRSRVAPILLLENSAGAGSTFGSTFVQLGALLEELSELPVGVALDTAHAAAAGFDITGDRGWRRTIDEFGRWIAPDRLRLIHANDLKSPRGSHVDRHWHIGEGTIGEAGFEAMGKMAELESLPVILETPGPEDELDRQNLQKMKNLLRGEASPKEVAP